MYTMSQKRVSLDIVYIKNKVSHELLTFEIISELELELIMSLQNFP